MQPPASLQALGDPIYEAFYGLKEQPFAITTDPRFFFPSASHERAFGELLNGLKRREGLLLVTGDTGTGKTTLCRAVTEALGERTFTAMVLNPYMVGAEVLRIVLRDFGLVSHEELRRGALASADIPQLLDTLEGFLKSLIPLGGHAIVVLDEAQALDTAVLDQIRLLTALECQGQRLTQVILCGQPGLLTTLKADSLTALNDRITRRVELAPLAPSEIEAYIHHRLTVAGGADAVAFDADAVKVVTDLSRGLPRRVNVLCDRALQEGRIEGLSTISGDLVRRAARALAGAHSASAAKPAVPFASIEREHPSTALPRETVEPDTPADGLMFEPPANHRLRNMLVAAAVIALAVAGAYYAYASSIVSTQASTPVRAPRPPIRNSGEPITMLDVPTDEEIRQSLAATVGPAFVPVAPAVTAPAAGPAAVTPPASPLSGQLPGNRNQLN